MSLRAKIIITFFVISSVVSLGLAAATCQILNRTLFGELRSRVRNLTSVGSLLVDRPALTRLTAVLREDLPAERIDAVEKGEDYALLSRELNAVRDTEPELVRYVYLFGPTADEGVALYVVDADVLELRAAGEVDGISHFGGIFDLATYPWRGRRSATGRSWWRTGTASTRSSGSTR